MTNKDNIPHFRTADRNQYLDTQTSGFVVRKRTPATLLSNSFMILSVLILAIVGVLYYDMLIGFYICLISGMMMFFISAQLKRINNIQLSTEFMNAAFSSVIGRDYRFCLVARSDGEIVYLNRPFQKLFPEFLKQKSLHIATLCGMQGVPQEEIDKLLAAVSEGRHAGQSMVMNVGEENTPETLMLTIEPVETPKGYAMVRGK